MGLDYYGSESWLTQDRAQTQWNSRMNTDEKCRCCPYSFQLKLKSLCAFLVIIHTVCITKWLHLLQSVYRRVVCLLDMMSCTRQTVMCNSSHTVWPKYRYRGSSVTIIRTIRSWTQCRGSCTPGKGTVLYGCSQSLSAHWQSVGISGVLHVHWLIISSQGYRIVLWLIVL